MTNLSKGFTSVRTDDYQEMQRELAELRARPSVEDAAKQDALLILIADASLDSYALSLDQHEDLNRIVAGIKAPLEAQLALLVETIKAEREEQRRYGTAGNNVLTRLEAVLPTLPEEAMKLLKAAEGREIVEADNVQLEQALESLLNDQGCKANHKVETWEKAMTVLRNRRAALADQGPEAEEGEAVIHLTEREIRTGLDRVRWAEGLVKQLPKNHEGRNDWLRAYGSVKEPNP